jgi:predicted TIM-barrel fold metal-dependent hydrolase
MIIDGNAFLGFWPFEVLACTTPAALAQRLRRLGIERALVSPVEAIFYKEPQEANEALVRRLRRYPQLLPVAVLNPRLPNWEESLRRNLDRHHVKAVKLHPNYHQYSLQARAAQAMLRALAEAGLPVIVQLQMEDARTHHPLVKVPPVVATEVLERTRSLADLKLILGAATIGDLAANKTEIAARPNVAIDISWLEQMDCMQRVLELVDAGRLLFGTHQPFFYPECAVFKVNEGKLSASVRQAILADNARRVFRLP